MKNHLKSFRDWIEALRANEDLTEIDREVDWNLEMGAITRRAMDLRAGTPLFHRVKGIETGFRALGAPGGLSAYPERLFTRIALALGLPVTATGRDLVLALAEAREKPPLPPRIVSHDHAPVKEHILRGEEVDLTRFPVPFIHGHDGGRYIQTYGINIVKTPDGSWTNYSINRMMLLDRNRIGCLIPPNQHFGMIHALWKEKGEPTPIAVAFGVEPGLAMAGGMPVRYGLDETAYLGAYFDDPIDLIPAETVELNVPATAEIVLEGHVSHTERQMEGPMDEFPGYLGNEGTPKPVFTVEAITYRTDPILPFSVSGVPVDENHTGWGIPHAAEVLYLLREAKIPVSICWTVLESANHLLVVALKRDWHESSGLSSIEIAERIGKVVFESKPGFGLPKILLVEDDFDVTDVAQVMWAFTSRAHPSHGEIYFKNEAMNNLPVFLDPDEKFSYNTTKVIHNALLADRFAPEKRPIASDFAHGWPKDIQEQVLKNWNAYGFR